MHPEREGDFELIAKKMVALMIDKGALKFGEFTLKSGRQSPYFFNLGAIRDGIGLKNLAALYAQALKSVGWECDVLFGPAYKGIPLASSMACELGQQGFSIEFAYNRKEAKSHGEGGVLVGEVAGRRVVIVDDILTAGTAAREAVAQITQAGGQVQGLLVALDRQEQGADGRSAVKALSHDYGFPVLGLARFDDIISYISELGGSGQLQALLEYRKKYGFE